MECALALLQCCVAVFASSRINRDRIIEKLRSDMRGHKEDEKRKTRAVSRRFAERRKEGEGGGSSTPKRL